MILLSWLFLQATYGPKHWLGAGLCVTGVALLVIFDAWQQGSAELQHPLLGDALVVLGAACYAMCNVFQEKMLGEGFNKSLHSRGCMQRIQLRSMQAWLWPREQ